MAVSTSLARMGLRALESVKGEKHTLQCLWR